MSDKEVLKKGFAIKKIKDSAFYTFDYTYTTGLSDCKKNSIHFPELILIGFPCCDAEKVLNSIAMGFFKSGSPTDGCIVEDLQGFENLSVALVKLENLKKIKKEMKHAELDDKTTVFQVVISNEKGIFDLMDYTGEKEIPVYFELEKKRINHLKRIKLPEASLIEHTYLLKKMKEKPKEIDVSSIMKKMLNK